MTRLEPTVVRAEQRTLPASQQTPGIRREEAFFGDDRWIGYITTAPGDWSGWHHHGSNDTYFYVLHGELEFEYDDQGATVTVGAGDFAHMPAGVVHRERTPGEPVEAIVVRIGSGTTVVNVEGPTS